ncbi:fructokinase [Paucilactobacillus oligofermentans DSM 15707 = LMG 22743]|uniref:Fructokinase n=1 Tax=Paucilactobacillus oligofermentans DSM 15707 = LMG 22743 TaxID=1423778 RepID=A0A0R1RPX5_9LACO|nr:fructokinase ScrK [Paucilactobacillus oligofermentans]KRL55443.1 fructokinase [Paucilactobacillus oligofermentans DSM 15707 = LMG 22743]CUS25572.1 Fructokinase [Paucilactobacillus oligofermentans DSM 15707 = LMG 22743]
MLIGSIEAGGTKFVCAIGNDNYQIQDVTYIPTGKPEETLDKVIEYFKRFDIKALGIASFGPLELRHNSNKYGFITTSPKLDWRNIDFLGYLKKEIDVPTFWTTDVNGSAYGEFVMSRLSNANINSLVYYTVGTGVGAGIISDGKFIGDIGHPEMGHVSVKRHPDDLDFEGVCPYHSDCLEGLVSGPTFEARLGKKGKDIPHNHPVWNIMAYYVAQALVQTTLMCRPGKIVIGGGVTNEDFLIKIRNQFIDILNGYIPVPNINEYITSPSINDNGSATIGNFALALKKLNE